MRAASLRDVADELGGGVCKSKDWTGAAYADIDNDGDLDVLITTNRGPALLYRNDQFSGNKSVRFRLEGTKSNRSGIGAKLVRSYYGDLEGSRLCEEWIELSIPIGIAGYIRVLGAQDCRSRLWSIGRAAEWKSTENVRTGRAYVITEQRGIQEGW